MENKTKMFICMGVLVLIGIIYQIVYGNQASLFVGGIMLFSIGFGWYACKTKSEEMINHFFPSGSLNCNKEVDIKDIGYPISGSEFVCEECGQHDHDPLCFPNEKGYEHRHKKCDLLALEIMPDHVHIFIGARPTHTPFRIVNQIKGNTSRQLRLLFKDLAFLGFPKKIATWQGFNSLWADGYYCGSAGHVSQETVKRYIQEQEGKKPFDYDIYECPEELKGQLKIGDFFG